MKGIRTRMEEGPRWGDTSVARLWNLLWAMESLHDTMRVTLLAVEDGDGTLEEDLEPLVGRMYDWLSEFVREMQQEVANESALALVEEITSEVDRRHAE